MSEADFDLLADYVGGALAGTPEHERVAALVATDPGWAREHEILVAALAATADDLATFAEQTAEPMPDAVVARLLDALPMPAPAAAAAAGAPAPGARKGDNRAPAARRPRSGPRSGDRPGGVRRRPRWLSWAAPALVAVVVAAFAGLWINQSVGTGTTATDSAAGAAESAARAPAGGDALTVPRFVTGRDYTADAVAGGFLVSARAEKSADVPRTFTTDTKDQSAAAGAVDPELLRLDRPGALAVCVDAIRQAHGRGPITVSAADFAAYQGRPAVMVFFTDSAGVRWGWVVGPDCGPAGTDELFHARVG